MLIACVVFPGHGNIRDLAQSGILKDTLLKGKRRVHQMMLRDRVVPICFASFWVFVLLIAFRGAQLSPCVRKIAKAPRRALVFPVILSAYATAQGSADNILSASPAAIDQAKVEGLDEVYKAIGSMTSLPTIGYSAAPAGAEASMTLHPDVIFVWKEQAEPLLYASLPVEPVQVGGRNPLQSRLHLWRRFGELSANQARGDALGEFYWKQRRRLDALLPESDYRTRVALLFRVGSGLFALAGKNYNLSDRLEMAGGENVGARQHMQMSFNIEALYLLDPDVIFINSNSADDDPERILHRPEWQPLRAVRAKRVYCMPKFAYINAATNLPLEEPLLIEWMSDMLHLDKLSSLRKDVHTAYRAIYGRDVSDALIDHIFCMRENASSAGYQRLH
jgi:ABC-type Fe3+-hydroxamate transport system substrate-binding protein